MSPSTRCPATRRGSASATPTTTVSGQHRYVLTYTLPAARLSTGELALDVIGTDETMPTEQFEIIVSGLSLDDPTCNVGAAGATGGCTLAPDGETYRAVISPLDRGEGVTIGGAILGRTAPVEVADPAIPARRSDNTVPLAAAMLPVGAAAAGGVYAWARRRGRNEVYAGGAADAAYGPGATAAAARLSRGPPVRLVADDDMGELATTEFVPPKGIDAVAGVGAAARAHRRRHGRARGSPARPPATSSRSPRTATTTSCSVSVRGSPRPAARTGRSCAGCSTARPRSPSTATTRTSPRRGGRCGPRPSGRSAARGSGRGSRRPAAAARPGSRCRSCSSPASWLFIGAGSLATALLGWISGPLGALAFGLVVPALAAFAMYRSLLPARSATGSALALRTESFRRFLAASEGRHVEWAWKPRPAARVLGVGRRPRRGVDVGAGDGALERPADRAVDADRCSCTAWARRSPAATRRRRAPARAAAAAASPAAVSEAGVAAAAPAPGRRRRRRLLRFA